MGFPKTLNLVESQLDNKRRKMHENVLIWFRTEPYERLLRTPFEDQAKRSSIERVEQEIELRMRVRLVIKCQS